MNQRIALTAELLPLYDYYIYHNLTQSLLLRNKGSITPFADGGALLSWGISTFVGGAFSQAKGEAVLAALDACSSPRWLYLPDDAWRTFVKSARPGRITDKCLRVYAFSGAPVAEPSQEPCIVPVTRELIGKNLPNTEAVTDELYSYTDMEDFFQTGFGLALVLDGAVAGYCLSEYSVDGSHGINIWVDEKYRRLGYARKMVNAFLRHCQAQNETAYWVCNADNLPSNRLAVACGFVLRSSMDYLEL